MKKVKTLSPREFRRLLKGEKKSLLLDVRSSGKSKIKNGIYGAMHLDFSTGDFQVDIKKCDKTCPVFVYCQTGEQSQRACHYMENVGFENLYHLAGGLSAYEEIFSQNKNKKYFEEQS